MKEHLLQSQVWENYEHLENQRTFRIVEHDFSAMAVLKQTVLGKYLFCPYGPTASSRNFQQALNALKQLANKQGAFFVRIEPPLSSMNDVELKNIYGLKKSHDIDPAHTWILDLTQSEAKIFSELEKEKGRLWRNYYKKGISIRQTKDPAQIDILTKLLSAVGRQNHFTPQKRIHLFNQMEAGFATLYVAELHNVPIAAALVYDYDGVRYYAHAAADYDHRKLAAGSILLVQMIVDAQRAGMKSFDFWGITTSEDRNHPWYGFTQFKKSFGGTQVNYAGTWDLPTKMFRYSVYRIIRKFNRIRRKIYHRS